MCFFIIKEKEKIKETKNKKKRNIKSRKIDKKKRKILVSKYTITLLGYILNFVYVILQNLYTCPSWVSILKTQFVGLSYPIDFLYHLLTGTINYKLLLSQQTLKNSANFWIFVLLNSLVLVISF